MSVSAKTFDPAPMDQAVVLDPQWLSHALSIGRAPVAVTAVELVQTIGWNCLALRIKLSYAEGRFAGLPPELVIKGLFGTRHREYLENAVLVAESNFYAHCGQATGMFLPPCVYGGVDEETGAGVVILHDLTPSGVRFYTGKDRFNDVQIHHTVDQLARLHGWSWGRSETLEPWVKSKLDRFVASAKVAPARLTEVLHGSRGALLPENILDGPRVYAALSRLHERGARISANFIHGDAHPGNTFDIGGRMGFLDWQILQRGSWSLDLAYHLGASLGIEDRRAKEQDLLRFYLDRLGEYGGTPPDWDIAWRLYRESVCYGYYLWAVTLRVDDDIVDANVTRLGQSVADHQSFELLGV